MIVSALATAALAGGFDHSHAAFADFLQGAVGDRGVDYAALKAREPQLDAYLAALAAADPSSFTPAQKLALAVNAYNAFTLKTVLGAGPPASIMDLDGGKVWDTRRFTLAGGAHTLNAIENQQARTLADGRVHAVLNCASRGCPPLSPAPLSADALDAQLDAAARRWAKTNAFRIEGGTLYLSKIFDWYGDDFVKENRGDLPGLEGEAENAAWFLVRFVDEPTKERLRSGALTAAWQDYDWSLNRQ